MTPQLLEQEIINEAEKLGFDASRLKPAQRRRIVASIKIREDGLRETFGDVGKMVASRGKYVIGLGQITSNRAEQNQRICEVCPAGKYKKLVGDIIACDACGCQGKALRAKLSDSRQMCPMGFWDNLYPDDQAEFMLTKLIAEGMIPKEVLNVP